ncbi:nuclear transport factor 2 family protein [Patescibacteria group bacterium]|nr:nuclear transport factor 2 family protein [Patescibacteria group bacterium]
MNKKLSKNIKLVLDILSDEVKGDVKSSLKKMHRDYTMTWVYQNRKGVLFPRSEKISPKDLSEVYVIKDRHYDIKNIAEGKNLVIVEMIESYTDPKTKKKFRTPLVIVLEFKDGKIKTGRHYCDPKLSYLYLSKEQVNKAFKK